MPEPSHRGFRTPCAGHAVGEPAPIVPLTDAGRFAHPEHDLPAPDGSTSDHPTSDHPTSDHPMLGRTRFRSAPVENPAFEGTTFDEARLDHPAGAGRPRAVPPPPPGTRFPDDAA
jgi:hypothetical protein